MRIDRPEWQRRALCRGSTDWPHEVPLGGVMPRTRLTLGEAAAVCAECPVMVECREYGRRTRSTGMWGGEYTKTGGARVEYVPLSVVA